MTAFNLDGLIGAQDLAETSTTAKHTLGRILKFKDSTYGVGEFIYLLGVASTAIGSIVTFDVTTWQTTLCAVGGAVRRPYAVAMSANVAAQYGWYQISGLAVAKKQCTVSLAAGAAIGVLSTGLIAGTASLKEVDGVVAAVASAAAGRTTVVIAIDRPSKMGRIS